MWRLLTLTFTPRGKRPRGHRQTNERIGRPAHTRKQGIQRKHWRAHSQAGRSNGTHGDTGRQALTSQTHFQECSLGRGHQSAAAAAASAPTVRRKLLSLRRKSFLRTQRRVDLTFRRKSWFHANPLRSITRGPHRDVARCKSTCAS